MNDHERNLKSAIDILLQSLDQEGADDRKNCYDALRKALSDPKADPKPWEKPELKAALTSARDHFEEEDPKAAVAVLRKHWDNLEAERLAAMLPEALSGDGWQAMPPEREWLVKGWLPANELALLSGPGDVGKSTLALQLGAALACNRERVVGGWLPVTCPPGKPSVAVSVPGLHPDPVRVVIAAWEDSRDEVLRRRLRLTNVCPWAKDPSINGRLEVLPMRGTGAVWAPAASGSQHIATVGELTPVGEALRTHCERTKARLLVLDPSALALEVDENNRALVSAALNDWAGWASDSGCAVLLTSHPAKAREGEGADYSGSTAWRGTVRALWTLRSPRAEGDKAEKKKFAEEIRKRVTCGGGRYPERLAQLTLNKSNYGPSGAALTLITAQERKGWTVTEPVSVGKSGKGAQKLNGGAPVEDVARV